MSPLRIHDRLAELAAEIIRLRVAIPELARLEREGDGDEAVHEMRVRKTSEAQTSLFEALGEHFDLTHSLRKTCPIHGGAARDVCADCTQIS